MQLNSQSSTFKDLSTDSTLFADPALNHPTVLSLCWHPERILPLPNGINFRDLGGYQTRTNKQVVWRKLFRSGANHLLNEQDKPLLNDLGIEVIADFRSSKEQQKAPTQMALLGEQLQSLAWQYELDMNEQRFMQALANKLDMTQLAHNTMVEFYQNLPIEFASRYRAVFEHLVEGKTVLFHCGAGKDRTGLMAFLLLTLLQVDETQILADYAMTEKVNSLKKLHSGSSSTSQHSEKRDDAQAAMFASLPKEAIDILMGSNPRYLHSAIEFIQQNFGSIEGYVNQQLGLSNDDIQHLRAHYLV